MPGALCLLVGAGHALGELEHGRFETFDGMPADLGDRDQPGQLFYRLAGALRHVLEPCGPGHEGVKLTLDEGERRHRRHAGERAFDRRLDGVKGLGDVGCRLLRQVKYLLLRRPKLGDVAEKLDRQCAE